MEASVEMSDVDNKVKMIVEGLLLAAGRPLSLDNIMQVFSEDERPDKAELKAVMAAISDACDDRGFELIEVASGYRFQVKQDLSEWVAKLWEEKPPRYTRALLETLALIAYRQPITRGDIEEIRGVAVSANIIRTLLDREWVRVVGHRDVPGRPAMFATTRQFLDYFNLKNLQELPPLSEIKELDSADREVDVNEALANQRVIDLPEDSVDEASTELSESEKTEMLAEEEAIELSKKPLDEILNLPGSVNAETDAEDEDDLLSEDPELEQLLDAAAQLEARGMGDIEVMAPEDPSASDEEPSASDEEPSASEEEPSASEEEPSAPNSESTFADPENAADQAGIPGSDEPDAENWNSDQENQTGT